MDDNKEQKREAHRSAIKIRAALENVDTLVSSIPNLSPEMKKDMTDKINELKKELLPFVQDSVKSIFSSVSEKLGTGADKKMWVLKNGKDGLEFWILKNVTAIHADKVLDFKLQKIYDRIDKYDRPEALVADTLTARLFSLEDYEIDKLPAPPKKETKALGDGTNTNNSETK